MNRNENAQQDTLKSAGAGAILIYDDPGMARVLGRILDKLLDERENRPVVVQAKSAKQAWVMLNVANIAIFFVGGKPGEQMGLLAAKAPAGVKVVVVSCREEAKQIAHAAF